MGDQMPMDLLRHVSGQMDRLQASLDEHRRDSAEQTRRIDSEVAVISSEVRAQSVRLGHLEGAAVAQGEALREAQRTILGRVDQHSEQIRELRESRSRSAGAWAAIVGVSSIAGMLVSLALTAASMWLTS